jgi:hypothetical protein
VAGRIEFVASRETLDYDYEISWRLTGNRTVSSGRQTTSSTILHVDEVPKTASSLQPHRQGGADGFSGM